MGQHYEARLENDLADIRRRVEAVGGRVEKALEDGIHALVTHNLDLATQVVLGDLAINRDIRSIDGACHAFVARHLPSAGHLRFVSSVLRLTVEIERVGDYAVSFGRHAEQLPGTPPERMTKDIQLMAEQARRMFVQAVRSFVEANAELARGTLEGCKSVETTFRSSYSDLVELGRQGQEDVTSLFSMLTVFNRLGRVGDQAKNICEETLFAVAGETKKPKMFRVLFLDERNDGLGLMAEAYARKAFSEMGHFTSAGWEASSEVAPAWLRHMQEKGLDHEALSPTQFDLTPEELARQHLLIGLNHDPRERLGSGVPFHTVCLRWQLPEEPEQALGRLQELAAELIETLHGDVSTRGAF